MTGELSDLFDDRSTGVATLASHLGARLGPDARVWMGPRGFGPLRDAAAHASAVGSTNFLATATLVAARCPDALLVDFGSTTADIVAIAGGKPRPRGLVDAERQATGELVYTGLTRTAVMAITTRVPLRGTWTTLAREYLATMADVRRILGDLPDGVDQHTTADGKGKTLEESVRRFARLFGRDAAECPLEDWRAAARFVAEVQLRSLHDGALQVLGACPLPHSAPVIAAGIGAADAARLAARLDRPVVSFGALVGADEPCRTWATRIAPAVSVALLAQ
jgi:probable H4MPT-linked C1 transfer pathway protein